MCRSAFSFQKMTFSKSAGKNVLFSSFSSFHRIPFSTCAGQRSVFKRCRFQNLPAKMFCFHHFRVFTGYHFQHVPVSVQFSKDAVFKICRQKCSVFIIFEFSQDTIFNMCRSAFSFQKMPFSKSAGKNVPFSSFSSFHRIPLSTCAGQRSVFKRCRFQNLPAKMFRFHHFRVFTGYHFQHVPVSVQFSKDAVFKICRQKCAVFIIFEFSQDTTFNMCRSAFSFQKMPFSKSAGKNVPFSCDGRAIRHILRRFQNMPASCERCLSEQS